MNMFSKYFSREIFLGHFFMFLEYLTVFGTYYSGRGITACISFYFPISLVIQRLNANAITKEQFSPVNFQLFKLKLSGGIDRAADS